MRSLSFRFKLLLAMMIVVCAITGATMYVAQSRLEAMQTEMFRREFENEIALFTQSREARLGAIKERCRTLVSSVRLVAAMHAVEEDPSAEVLEALYDNAKDELSLRGEMRRTASFYRFLDQDGTVLPNPALSAQRNTLLETKLRMPAVASGDTEQEIGYLPLPEENGSIALHEVIVTKIFDRAEDAIIGALVIGFPFEQQGLHENSKLQSGLVVEKDLYSLSVPAAERDSITALAGRTNSKQEHGVLKLGGVPHSVHVHNLNLGTRLPAAWHVALLSMAPALQERAELRAAVLALGAAAMALALLLSWLLSQGLTGPINALVKGTDAVRQGDFSVRVPVQSHDEIGELTNSFNQMTTGLALKEKYRSVLDLVADKGIAEELINGRIELGGEERIVSVLFCDIRGFTALTEKMQPPEVIQMLNEHFTPLTRVVYEHNGVVDKFVGDLIMAIFGAPKSSGNDAENAVNCALAMMRERTELNLSSKYKIRIGIGVATGKAVAGRMGSNDRMNYTVLGPKVNLASRLCGQAGPMEVVVDQETLDHLPAQSIAEPMPEMKLKGFAEVIKAWKVKPKNSA